MSSFSNTNADSVRGGSAPRAAGAGAAATSAPVRAAETSGGDTAEVAELRHHLRNAVRMAHGLAPVAHVSDAEREARAEVAHRAAVECLRLARGLSATTGGPRVD
jgi:hypothetical protein